MVDPLNSPAESVPPRFALRHVAVVLIASAAMVVMLLTSRQMSDLRYALPPLSRALNWLDRAPVPMDMYHVVFFAVIALATRLLLPRVRWWWLVLGLCGLALATELLQFWTIGREPSLLDVRDDVVGLVVGVLLGAILLWCAGQVKGRWRRLRWRTNARLPRLRNARNTASIGHMTDQPAAGVRETPRTALANWLVRRSEHTPAEVLARDGLQAVVAACEREGVVSLLHARLSEMGAVEAVPAELLQALSSRARLNAGRNLLCMSEARKIQHALDQAGIPAIWLKGIAIGQWLYPRSHLRDIADIDLLLPDHATTMRAAEVLAPLGYVLPNAHIAGDLVVRELLAFSQRTRLELDLHWDLSNGALFAGRLPWATLLSDAMAIPGLGEGARGLSPTHAFLHACLHLAVGKLVWPEDRLRWLYDIHLLAQDFDAATWAQLVRAATDARLADPCAYALRSCVRVFATVVDEKIIAALESAALTEPVRSARLGNWGHFQWACWRRLPDLRTRLRWLRQVLFPDMAHLRDRYGADGGGALKVTARRLRDGCLRWWGYMRRASR